MAVEPQDRALDDGKDAPVFAARPEKPYIHPYLGSAGVVLFLPFSSPATGWRLRPEQHHQVLSGLAPDHMDACPTW